jgi:leucyl/phenylalanyl-tRNA---protein transferase
MAELPMSPVAAHSLVIGMRRQRAVASSRANLFRETLFEKLARYALGTAFAFHPKRIADLPYLCWEMLRDLARGGTVVPDPAATYPRADSFAGVMRKASPSSILAGARLGFFPLSHMGPLKWWTRKNRMVLMLGEQRTGKNVRRLMRKNTYQVTFDAAFDEVIKACAGRRKGRPALTWITPHIMRLYAELHDLGHAHSFEVWNTNGELVGGGYGVAVGRVFYTESQFSRERDTSKLGFATLNHHLEKWGFIANDGKDETPALSEVGFELMPRASFEALLAKYAHAGSKPGRWNIEWDPVSIAG